MKTKKYDLNLVREYLEYQPATGQFIWAKDVGYKLKKGQRAGSIASTGYVEIGAGGQRFLAHRLAWLMHYGVMPEGNIDHINGNPTDNRIDNLRDATSAENGRNSRTPYHNTSGVKGVSWHKHSRKWVAVLGHEKNKIYVGAFDLIGDAETAIRSVRESLHGDFANHGFPHSQEKAPAALAAEASLRPAATERV